MIIMPDEELTVGDIWRRQGRVLIPRELMKNSMLFVMEELMSRMIVVRCEHLAMNDEFEYYAVSKEFDPVPYNEVPPYYTAEIETEDGEFKKLSFVKSGWQEEW